MTNQSSTSAPAISLPKGGGAIKGIGETFQPNLFTGTGNYSVPIASSPARSGFNPTLTLQYSSGNGNGVFGLGWNLAIPRIARKTEKGLPTYSDTDVFVMSGTEDLVRCLIEAGGDWLPEPPLLRGSYSIVHYRPRTEGLFARIEQWVRNDGDVHWRVISRDNVTSLYGKTHAARILDPASWDEPPSRHRVFEWLLQESFDAKGNHILYEYAAEEAPAIDAIYEERRAYAQKYLRRVLYCNSHRDVGPQRTGTDHRDPLGAATRRYLLELVFDYGDVPAYDYPAGGPQELTTGWTVRPDRFSTFRAGFEIRTLRRCERVLMFHHFEELGGATLVRSTDFDYRTNDDTGLSLLAATHVRGYRRQDDGTYAVAGMPPVTFRYSEFRPQEQRYQPLTATADDLPAWSLAHPEISLVDLQGDGLPDVLQATPFDYRVWTNQGEGRLQAPRRQQAVPAGVTPSQPGVTFGDMAGDGLLDLVVEAPGAAGFYETTTDGQWTAFRSFPNHFAFDVNDPSVRFIDLTGDGRPDALQTREQHFVWFECKGEMGYGAPRVVPRAFDPERFPDVHFNDPSGRVRLADMNGDGLSDIVLLHNGRVDYWPNLGYGRFGPRITMEHAPRLESSFDPRRLFLADLDGSGCADLVYVDSDRVRFWFNRSGNGWSDQQVTDGTPAVTDMTAVQFGDVFGTGTATLVWTYDLPHQPRGNYKALDFCGGVKPYVLTEMNNNLGATTRVRYAPSTKFYLEDKRAGRPWVTSLPFSVHVVEKVEVIDHISRTKLVTTYKYHHGYYDGRDREFRGFGRVDQFDTEIFEDFTQPDLHGTEVAFTNGERSFHVPPVEMRSWFHTGVYFDPDRLDAAGEPFAYEDLDGAYQREYYQGDREAFPLPDHEYRPAGGPAAPLGQAASGPEAYRALRGALLRTEVYGRDRSPAADHPYVVSANRYFVREFQPRDGPSDGVYLANRIEGLTYYYERNPADPRIAHEITLDVDDLGNVLKSAAIGYRRRHADPALPAAADREKQARTLVAYTEVRYTNALEHYRTPLPCETRTYELTGYAPSGPGGRFEPGDFVRAGAGAVAAVFDGELSFEEKATTGRQRRLTGCARTLYRPDDLGVSVNDPLALLPLGIVQSLALPGETYKLALTPGLLGQVFVRDGGNLLPPNPADLLEGGGPGKGGYVELDGDGRWWSPTGRAFYSPGANDTAQDELHHAARHFFLPHRYRDPFHTPSEGTETIVRYDAYDLLMLETRDPVGNRITVGERLPNGDPDPAAPGNDYRVLQPCRVMDANRNRAQVAFDALGMVVGTAMLGKPEHTTGDSLDGFVSDLPESTLLDHLADPLAHPQSMIVRARSRMMYDLFAYQRTKDQPHPAAAVVHMLVRETHASDLEGGNMTRVQQTFSYWDGFGREIQKKMQAEPETAGGVAGPSRWVGSGWTVFNNKSKPVLQYEPFFSATHGFEFNVQAGVSPILFYDPMTRVVATIHANHAYDKVVFQPWQHVSWDVNDTVLEDPRTDAEVAGSTESFFGSGSPSPFVWQTWYEQRQGGALGSVEWQAAAKAAGHARTPTTEHLDPLGRPFLTVRDNGPDPAHSGRHLLFGTRVDLDIQGNPQTVRDAIDQAGDGLGRVVLRCNCDVLGNRIHQHGMDEGQRWMVSDVTGKPLAEWGTRGYCRRTEYDRLRRPRRGLVTGADPANPSHELMTELFAYGEQHPEAELRNLRGRLYLHLDPAGASTHEAYDFKGNPLRATRRFAREYKRTIDWRAAQGAFPDGIAHLSPAAVDAAILPLLEAECFTSSSAYDALDRLVTVTTPHTPAIQPSVIRPAYNEAGLLERVDVQLRGATDDGQPVWTPFVVNIDYDAKGQRRRIEYGNGVSTGYEHDRLTFRLMHALTSRNSTGFPHDCPHPPATGWPGCHVQNLKYTYDPAGNVTHIRDEAQQRIFFRNRRVDPDADYTYDALYRVIDATGREHLGQASGAPQPGSHDDAGRVGIAWAANDGTAMGTYVERYAYDAVGNILEVQHRGSDPAHPGWTRRYEYREASLSEDGAAGTIPKRGNRLSRAITGGATPWVEQYTYDAHGNLLRMPHLAALPAAGNMHWNYQDQLRQVDLPAGATAYYVYDGEGQRVRKVCEKPGLIEERLYLGGFEIFRRRNAAGAVTLERETLHVADDKRRVALVETRTRDETGSDPAPPRLIRYQFGNHLGSVSLELDEWARIISYEEYTPFGSTSCQSVRSQNDTPKRYRYTSQERDEESGFYYHGARYYAPWLGRWVNPDPAGLVGGMNLYAYVGNNPIAFVDPTGLDGEPAVDEDGPTTYEKALPYFQFLFGAEGMRALRAFQRSGNTWEFTDVWGDLDVDWKDSVLNVNVQIEEDLSPIAAAMLMMQGLETTRVYWTAGLDEIHARDWERFSRAYVREAAQLATAAAEFELGVIGIVNEGTDWILTVREITDGNLMAIAALLPFISVGMVKVVDNTGAMASLQKYETYTRQPGGVLPPFGTGGRRTTTANFAVEGVGEIGLQSRSGGAGTGAAATVPRQGLSPSARRILTRGDVEAQAAAIMRHEGITDASMVTNHPTGVCRHCKVGVREILPPGSRLRVDDGVIYAGVGYIRITEIRPGTR